MVGNRFIQLIQSTIDMKLGSSASKKNENNFSVRIFSYRPSSLFYKNSNQYPTADIFKHPLYLLSKSSKAPFDVSIT